MLIQNIGNVAQAAQPVGRVNDGAPKVVADTSNAVPAQQPSPAQLKSVVDSMNHAMQQSHISLEFSVDSTTKTPVISLSDSATGQVILQFPSKAALAIAQSIEQSQQRPGLLLNQKA